MKEKRSGWSWGVGGQGSWPSTLKTTLPLEKLCKPILQGEAAEQGTTAQKTPTMLTATRIHKEPYSSLPHPPKWIGGRNSLKGPATQRNATQRRNEEILFRAPQRNATQRNVAMKNFPLGHPNATQRNAPHHAGPGAGPGTMGRSGRSGGRAGASPGTLGRSGRSGGRAGAGPGTMGFPLGHPNATQRNATSQ